MSVRRVVTGSRAGRAVFVADDQVEPVTLSVMPGFGFYPLWGADAPVSLPTDGEAPAAPNYFPPAGGFRFGFVTFPPATTTAAGEVDMAGATAEIEEKLPGLIEHMEPDHPGMHTTDTIDFDVVLAGEVWLELDDSEETRLQAGDCVIVNGTRHAWHNRSDQPCSLAVAIVGAPRS
jgi:hypothetical protein